MILGLGLGLQYPRGLIGGGAPFSGILNQFTGGAFGASLRLLNENYAGGLIRVRAWNGAIDQGQADIMPFKIGDNWWVSMNSLLTNLDATALARGLTTSHVLADLVDAGGANYDGFVPKIYEQLNGNDFTQGTALRQGNLITAGVLNTLNGKPVIHRVDEGAYLSSYKPNGTGKSLYYVGDNNGNTSCLFGSNTGSSDFSYLCTSGSGVASVNSTITVFNQKINDITAVYSNRGEIFTLTNKQFLLSTDVDFNFSDDILALGYRFSNTVSLGMYSFQEAVIWDNQLDRLGKEDNTNNAFTIY